MVCRDISEKVGDKRIQQPIQPLDTRDKVIEPRQATHLT
jgi:hypothetical protein